MTGKFPITKKAYLQLQEEIKNLKTHDRPAITKAIAEARELGDLSENAEYHAAREKQSFIEGRIQELEDKVARADVIDISKLSGDKVKFGATVHLFDHDKKEDVIYKILGEYEADITKRIISLISPLARALMGKAIGEDIEVITPGGTKSYEIKLVSFIEEED